MKISLFVPLCYLSLAGYSLAANAQVAVSSPRMTPLVKVIATVEPAVVAIFVPDAKDEQQFSSGSAAIIHPDGYALTNNHVLPNEKGFAVVRGEKPLRFQVVGRSPEKDLAVIKLIGKTGPFATVELGRSNDLMMGETIAVAGNPGGRGTIVTSGIVSSIGTQLTAPNALWAATNSMRWRDDYIQYDAATNRGNSGGPIVNMESQLIGIVAALIPSEQNSNFAIPVDRARRLIHRMVEPELVHGRFVGLQLDPFADKAIVTEVISESPASEAGIQTGDVLQSVGGRPLRHAADWSLLLDHFLQEVKPIAVDLLRGDDKLVVSILPTRLEPMPATGVVENDQLINGLRFEFYPGEFSVLPDFATLNPSQKGVADTLDLKTIAGNRKDYYALRLKGLMRVPDDGLYRVHLTSDDGSRLHLGNDVFLDHDGNHPPMTLSRLCRLRSGLHPIEIDYFEGYGENLLELKLERLDVATEPFVPTFQHLK